MNPSWLMLLVVWIDYQSHVDALVFVDTSQLFRGALYFIAIRMVLGLLGLVVSLRTNFRIKRELVRRIESPSPHTIDDVDHGIINNEQDDISTETENNF